MKLLLDEWIEKKIAFAASSLFRLVRSCILSFAMNMLFCLYVYIDIYFLNFFLTFLKLCCS